MTVKGCRRVLTPFAPDQSGAVAALYGLGGISVIVDAGGCTGNICGFDEPRWLTEKAAVFSAGLRDMDAILGRDDKLIEKLTDAAGRVGGSFAALIGTPVPAVIGTDFRAL
ncbi:MAG: nitrogenase molybdenum-iron protein, partial [Lachnospiraceae bacterium]|nr:nitrogenase molybdenum-iron protein [Lachnospiraceae bacterium]